MIHLWTPKAKETVILKVHRMRKHCIYLFKNPRNGVHLRLFYSAAQESHGSRWAHVWCSWRFPQSRKMAAALSNKHTFKKKKKAQVREKGMLVPHFQFPISPSEDFHHISRIYLGHTAMCKLLFVIENENTTADSYRTRFSLYGCPCSPKDITLVLIKVSEFDY